MTTFPDRILTFERCFNFRDIGGYAGLDGRPVRWRRIFRSMTPEHMSKADTVAVAELDISLVIDFRGSRNESSGPLPSAGGMRAALSPAPPQPTDADDLDRFRKAPPQEALPRLLDTYGKPYAQALQTMSEHPDANALFHCRLGKDRTGVFAALVLKLLGVSDDDVVQDYMLTEQQEPFCRRLLEEAEPEVATSREPEVAKEPPSRAAIEGMLQRLFSQYGGAYGYFAHYGVRATAMAAFVENALYPPLAALGRVIPDYSSSREPVSN